MKRMFSYCQCLILFSMICFLNGKPRGRPAEKVLSEIPHHAESKENHDIRYDHEAFLGKEESEKFDKLSPEESKKKLMQIGKLIDKDNDSRISYSELQDWIRKVSQRYIVEGRDTRWKELMGYSDLPIDLQTYLDKNYGADPETGRNEKDKQLVRQLITNTRRRWFPADTDKDEMLSKEEFLAFLYPQEFHFMKEVVIDEALDDVDLNKDGVIDIDEYMKDVWSEERALPGETKPDWVDNEYSRFSRSRDTNSDGVMDRDEIGEWLMPDGYDPVEAETSHLMHHADINKDNHLNREEILDKHEIFVGSYVTNYGKDMHKFSDHEEL